METWEYLYITFHDAHRNVAERGDASWSAVANVPDVVMTRITTEFFDLVDEAGGRGWEAVSFGHSGTEPWVFMKRPLVGDVQENHSE